MLRIAPIPSRQRPGTRLPVTKTGVIDIGKIRARLEAGAKKCPRCGSTEHALMPTDFETAKCTDCGNLWEIGAGGPGSGPRPGYTRLEQFETDHTGQFDASPLTGRQEADYGEHDPEDFKYKPENADLSKVKMTDEVNTVYKGKVKEYLDHPSTSRVDLTRDVNGHLFIEDGNHRVVAALLRGDKTIPARVRTLPRAVSGGGPGSGRHAEYGDMHKLLVKRGYELHRSTQERQSYIHPDSRVHIQVNPRTGGWRRAEYPDHEGGHGVTTLHSYLRGRTHKIAAGGPGSGRHAGLWQLHDELKDAPLRMVNTPLSHTNLDLLRGKDKPQDVTAGGPGSGCRGPNCGRPKSGVASIPKATYHLSPKDRAIETRFRKKISANPERMMLEYRARFGNVLNADNAKELSDDAMKPPEAGGGRTVPMDEMAKQYTSVLGSMKALQEKFGSNPNFEMAVVDNSRGAGRAVVSSLDKLTPEIRTPSHLANVLKQHLDEAYKNGTVSRKIYKATLGNYKGAEEIGM